MVKKALIIDHDDSFIWNIKFWLEPEFNTTIINHSALSELPNPKQFCEKFDLIIFSPGPKSPSDYPASLNLLRSLAQPVVGICLGFQMMISIAEGQVAPYSPPLHGKTSALDCAKLTEFHNLAVARYHSLHCIPSEQFKILAYTQDDRTVMWAQHKTKKHLGFQFHPESFLTEHADKYKNYILKWMIA